MAALQAAAEAVRRVVVPMRDACLAEVKREEGERWARYAGVLKPHQVEGVQWLSAMYDCGCSALLGDEMGLGKTAQAIAMLLRLRAVGLPGPFLVVAPKAVLLHWKAQLEEWPAKLGEAPLRVVTYHQPPAGGSGGGCPALLEAECPALLQRRRAVGRSGMLRAFLEAVVTDATVLLTTPQTLCADMGLLAGLPARRLNRTWQYVVVDEAHCARNGDGELHRRLLELDADGYLLLTATYMNNNIESELGSLLRFLLPPALLGADVLRGLDEALLHHRGGERQLGELRALLSGFVLRREVLGTPGFALPPKRTITLLVPQTPAQKAAYALLETGVYLRRLCDKHPLLVGTNAGVVEGSFKVRLLVERLLPTLLLGRQGAGGVLVFSNSLPMLALLGHVLQGRGFPVDVITGESAEDVEERRARMDRFNSRPGVLLLSTMAMSQGIELIGADTVVFFDSHFNTQVDNQAEGRAHRLGQTRPVLVLRLVTGPPSQEYADLEGIMAPKRRLQEALVARRPLEEEPQEPPPVSLDTPGALEALLLGGGGDGLVFDLQLMRQA